MVCIFQFCVTTLLNVTGTDKHLHLYILAHSCHSKPLLSSFLSPRDAFRNWDTPQDGLLRSIYRSQAGGQRRGDTTRHKIEKLEEPSDWRLRKKLTPSNNPSESLSEWDLVLFLRTAVVSLSFMLMLCVTQLRRMQEMIAKMQAQMQNQGAGEGEAWKVSGKSQTGGHTQHLL